MSDRPLNHPILEQSFATIDRLVGKHHLGAAEYAIARRIIHATADFEFLELLRVSEGAIPTGMACLREKLPIIADVSMVREGIKGMVEKTFSNPIVVAIEQVAAAAPGKTRTETGLLQCARQYPRGIYLIGNAPTALLALCQQISLGKIEPSLVIAAPVGFVSVIEAKETLGQMNVPQIRVDGNKGGSAVAAAILNALLVLAWQHLGDK